MARRLTPAKFELQEEFRDYLRRNGVSRAVSNYITWMNRAAKRSAVPISPKMLRRPADIPFLLARLDPPFTNPLDIKNLTSVLRKYVMMVQSSYRGFSIGDGRISVSPKRRPTIEKHVEPDQIGESKSRRDRQILVKVAETLWSALYARQYLLKLRLRPRMSLDPKQSGTGGWKLRIGRFARKPLYAEVWFDQFPGSAQRKLWFGLYSTNVQMLCHVADSCTSFPKPLRIGRDEIERAPGTREWRLKAALTKVDFQRPLLENYGWRGGFFGWYVMDGGRPRVGPIDRVVARMTAFYELIAAGLNRNARITPDDEAYAAFENRLIPRLHLARERNGKLPIVRKQKDGYRCQICTMTFVEVYGVLGIGVADAHHVVALATLRRRTQRDLNDLITVCPNCHRILHRMEGRADDIDRLQEIVRRQKAKRKMPLASQQL